MEKILIIQTASIGDVILATPVIEKLHAFYPAARIDFLTKSGNEGLLKEHPLIKRLIIWDKSEKKYKHLLEVLSVIKERNYDLVVNLQRFATTGLLTAFSGAGKTIGFSKNPFSPFFSHSIKHKIGTGVHERDRNHELIKGITDEIPGPVKLYPNRSNYARMSQYKTVAYICIAPSSLWFTKQLTVEQWVDFAAKLPTGIRIYFIGSKQDIDTCAHIINASGHKNALNQAGKLNLLESAALMRDARMNYVNDSAPLHLASAVNAPVTAIFCSTIPGFGFGPLSDNSHIVETLLELSCKPCGLHGFEKCPKKHFKCAKTIKTEQLLNTLQEHDEKNDEN